MFNKKPNNKKSANQNVEDDFMNSIKEMAEGEKSPRKIGLYGELDGEKESIWVNDMGDIVALAEYFTEDYCEVNVYQPSSYTGDPISSYNLKYEELNEGVLHNIVQLCEVWMRQSETV